MGQKTGYGRDAIVGDEGVELVSQFEGAEATKEVRPPDLHCSRWIDARGVAAGSVEAELDFPFPEHVELQGRRLHLYFESVERFDGFRVAYGCCVEPWLVKQRRRRRLWGIHAAVAERGEEKVSVT